LLTAKVRSSAYLSNLTVFASGAKQSPHVGHWDGRERWGDCFVAQNARGSLRPSVYAPHKDGYRRPIWNGWPNGRHFKISCTGPYLISPALFSSPVCGTTGEYKREICALRPRAERSTLHTGQRACSFPPFSSPVMPLDGRRKGDGGYDEGLPRYLDMSGQTAFLLTRQRAGAILAGRLASQNRHEWVMRES